MIQLKTITSAAGNKYDVVRGFGFSLFVFLSSFFFSGRSKNVGKPF